MRGWRVLVASPGGEEICRLLKAAGAVPVAVPTISIRSVESPDLDAALRDGETYDWIAVTSANGVTALFDRLRALGLEPPHGPRWAAVGPATARALEAAGVRPAAVPEAGVGAAVPDEMGDVDGRRVLLARAAGAGDDLPAILRERGARVAEAVAYETVEGPEESRAELRAALDAGLDAAIFTSGSTARGFVRLAGDPRALEGAVVVVIGPSTAAAARAAGLEPAAVARERSPEGLVAALSAAAAVRAEADDTEPRTDSQEHPMSRSIDLDPSHRLRRLRRGPALRGLVAETRLDPARFLCPLFVRPGDGVREPIPSMPGQERLSVDALVEESRQIAALGIGGVLLFGLPESKDPTGTGAYAEDGIVQRAIRALKADGYTGVVVADVCLCEYTDHGHCGVLAGGDVANDETLPLLAETSVSLAEAGADLVAPSAMMDGQVAAIREGLDGAGLGHVPILSYAAKYASAFYGPFREAADSTPAAGDRRGYQMDPPNAREAMREIEADLAEGADLIMVKPALPYLDVIRAARETFDAPLAAYHVSGEYAMLHAAAERGWLDLERTALESLTAIARAGAEIQITYFARDAARWLA